MKVFQVWEGGPDWRSSRVTTPRVHKHRYCGVLAPNARLRKAVTATAGPAGAVLQRLEEARRKMGLADAGVEVAGGDAWPEIDQTGGRDDGGG